MKTIVAAIAIGILALAGACEEPVDAPATSETAQAERDVREAAGEVEEAAAAVAKKVDEGTTEVARELKEDAGSDKDAP